MRKKDGDLSEVNLMERTRRNNGPHARENVCDIPICRGCAYFSELRAFICRTRGATTVTEYNESIIFRNGLKSVQLNKSSHRNTNTFVFKSKYIDLQIKQMLPKKKKHKKMKQHNDRNEFIDKHKKTVEQLADMDNRVKGFYDKEISLH